MSKLFLIGLLAFSTTVFAECTPAMIRNDECTIDDVNREQNEYKQLQLNKINKICMFKSENAKFFDNEYDEIDRMKKHIVNIGDSLTFVTCALGIPEHYESINTKYSTTIYLWYNNKSIVITNLQVTLISNKH